ncbi:MAG: BspA family leucine-rich repeat surface protein [Ruminococcus sp.]|nr:BspA family leucine-rich repeat surface protein [Ruminococcus sp.]
MKNKLLKKLSAVLLCTAVLGVGMPVLAADKPVSDCAVTAEAADYGFTYDRNLGVLTLTGPLNVSMMRNYIRDDYPVYSIIAAEGAVLPEDCDGLFSGFRLVETIDLTKADCSAVTSMCCLFQDCAKLRTVDMSGLKTINVTDMSSMFQYCDKLETVNLSGMKTSKLKRMDYMFYGCEALKNVDFTGWDTKNVTDMSYMFCECTSLEVLDITPFNTARVEDMSYMFAEDSYLKVIYAGYDWTTERLKDDGDHLMFLDCTSLMGDNGTTVRDTGKKYAKIDGFDQYYGYFSDKNWDPVNHVLYLRGNVKYDAVRQYANDNDVMYVYAEEGAVLPKYCRFLFADFKAIQIGLFNADAYNVTDMRYMFEGCINLYRVDLSGLNAIQNTTTNCMFANCKSLKFINLKGFYTGRVTNMDCMFMDCESLVDLDLSGLVTTRVTTMDGMFARCKSLKNLNISDLNTQSVTDMAGMFMNCESLASLDLSSFNTAKVTDMGEMFDSCKSLKTLDLSNFNTANVESMKWMFSDCSSLTDVNLSSFNTAKVTDMELMFSQCKKLTSLDLSSFDTSKVTNMYGMFSGDTALKTIVASDKWKTGSVTKSGAMFNQCTSLVGGNGTTYYDGHTDKAYAVCDKTKHPGYLTYKEPDFKTNSMTLGGAISLNFYIDLSTVPEAWRSSTYVTFEVNGKKYNVNFDPNRMNSKKIYYGFNCPLNSVSMADNVKATLHYLDYDGDEAVKTTVSTAETYLRKFNSSDTEKTWNLIKGINDFGYYMQEYLSKRSSKPWTLGVDHVKMQQYFMSTGAFQGNKSAYLTALEPYKKSVSLKTSDIKAVNYSLVLDSETNINFKIRKADGYKGTVKVKVDGISVTPTTLTDGRLQVSVKNIAAHKLGETHTVTITTSSGTSTFKASALSYVYECIKAPKTTDDDPKGYLESNAMSAMYEYYKAAMAYK